MGTLSINSTTGEIDVSASDAGEYIITRTVTNSPGSLSTTATDIVTINPADNAAFSYSGSPYDLASASNPTPTVTGLSGGAFSAALTVSPFKMRFEVPSNTQRTITINKVKGTSFTVDWGDGYTETNTGSDDRNISHTYNDGNNNAVTNPIVSIGAYGDTGAFTAFRTSNFDGDDVENYLLDIPQWGSIQWSTMFKTFRKALNSSFDISATDTPDFSNCINLQEMFANAQMGNISTSGNLANWDVSNITNITYFHGSTNAALNFNPDITGWNTQNVTGAYFPLGAAFNRNLSNWPLNANLTTFGYIFGSTSMSIENYTDTIVGWAVTVYKQSAPYNVVMNLQYGRIFDCSRTSDNASGQTYAAKYGGDWTATGWTTAGDARDYLTGTTANWNIANDSTQNC